MTTKQDPWLSIDEVCDDLGVARSTLDDWRRDGRGPAFTRLPNNKLRLRESAYHGWLATLAVV